MTCGGKVSTRTDFSKCSTCMILRGHENMYPYPALTCLVTHMYNVIAIMVGGVVVKYCRVPKMRSPML